jgi:20S proteasome alpha/beta subunit
VTVCIAALFRWNYGASDNPAYGVAAVTVSDRMITAGDVQYEPEQKKVAFLTPRTFVLIAGDYSTHTQAIYRTAKEFQSKADANPKDIVNCYGRAIRDIKTEQAEKIYLAPLNLNTDTFLAQQRDLSDDFVRRITEQLQKFNGEDVEALIVGGDGINAHIYAVDTMGIINCLDDVGFGAVGIGAWHARSRLMQVRYVNSVTLAPALAATYSAKKAAEIAPGVGRGGTDIHLVFRDAIENLRNDLFEKIGPLYADYEKERAELERKSVEQLLVFITTLGATEARKAGEGISSPEESSKGDGGASV